MRRWYLFTQLMKDRERSKVVFLKEMNGLWNTIAEAHTFVWFVFLHFGMDTVCDTHSTI